MCLALLVDREEGEGVSSSSYPSFIFFSGPHCRRLIFPASHLSTFSPTRRHLSLSLSLSDWLRDEKCLPVAAVLVLLSLIWVLSYTRSESSCAIGGCIVWGGQDEQGGHAQGSGEFVLHLLNSSSSLTHSMFMFLLVSAAVLITESAWFHLTVHVWSPTAVNIFQTFQ